MFLVAVSAAFLAVLEYTVALEHVPVFILDNGLFDNIIPSQKKAFTQTTKEDFIEIADQMELLTGCVVFFIENQLCMEDITFKDEKGTPFPNLKQSLTDDKTKFFLNVFQPYNYLKSRFKPEDFNTFTLKNSTTKLRLADENYKFLYIYFDDAVNESRIDTLRRHDAIMKGVFFALQSLLKGPIIAVYTGMTNPVVLKNDSRRSAVLEATRKSWYLLECGRGVFEFHHGKLLKESDQEFVLKPRDCKPLETPAVLTYDILFDTWGRYGKGHSYWLRYTFATEPEEWNLEDVKWLTENHNVISAQPQLISQKYENYYKSSSPLRFETKDWGKLKLIIENFKILIHLPTYKKHTPVPTDRATTAPDSSVLWDPQIDRGLVDNEGNMEVLKENDDITERSFRRMGKGGQRQGQGEANKTTDKTTEKTTEATTESQTVVFPLSAIVDNTTGNATNGTNGTTQLTELLASEPIISSLMPVMMCLGLLFWGIGIMMPTCGNDKFDSTDSKTAFHLDEHDN